MGSKSIFKGYSRKGGPLRESTMKGSTGRRCRRPDLKAGSVEAE